MPHTFIIAQILYFVNGIYAKFEVLARNELNYILIGVQEYGQSFLNECEVFLGFFKITSAIDRVKVLNKIKSIDI